MKTIIAILLFTICGFAYAAGDESAARGKVVYDKYCSKCHGKNADGRGKEYKQMKATVQISPEDCTGCGDCVEYCQFGALSVDSFVHVDSQRCLGCGVCVSACLEEAFSLVRRPESEIEPPPLDEAAWFRQRAAQRGLDINLVL